MVSIKELERKFGRDLEKVLSPILYSSKFFYVFVFLLIMVIALGLYAYYTQLIYGLAVTGLNDTVIWGLYISNFVYFIGVAHAGALIAALLKVVNAEWRRPIARIAEAITPIGLIIAVTMVIVDLGRPDRIINLFIYGRIESPLIWDFFAITAYLVGSSIFLYLSLIPDIALLRDELHDVPGWKRKIYEFLSINWRGSERQRKRLEKAINIMAILVIPIMVSASTVVSWIFAAQLRVGWHTAAYGPYFVVGAIYSGVATVIIIIAILRRLYGLEKFIKKEHFNYLSLLLLSLGLAYAYFTINDYFIPFYGGKVEEMMLLTELALGRYAHLFWFTIITGFIIPIFILACPKTRTIAGSVIASVLVNLAMWLKRFLIIVPSLATPVLPYEWGVYFPTWVEFSIIAASFAIFILLYMLLFKLFPIIPLWEVFEGEEVRKT